MTTPVERPDPLNDLRLAIEKLKDSTGFPVLKCRGNPTPEQAEYLTGQGIEIEYRPDYPPDILELFYEPQRV